MKRLMIVITMICMLMPVMVSAAEFRFAEEITIQPMAGPGFNLSGENKGNGGTLDLYIGQIGGYYQGDWKLLGLGGMLITVTSRLGGGTAYNTSFVPATFFGDSFAPAIGYNWTDKTATISVPISFDVMKKLWSTQDEFGK